MIDDLILVPALFGLCLDRSQSLFYYVPQEMAWISQSSWLDKSLSQLQHAPFCSVAEVCLRENTRRFFCFCPFWFDCQLLESLKLRLYLAWFNFAENQDGRVFGESWPLALFAGYPQQHSNWGAEIQVALETRFENPLINMQWSAIIILIFLLISDSNDMEDMLADIIKADELISAMEEKFETM